MAKKKETTTTRNQEFNYFVDNVTKSDSTVLAEKVRHTVLSTTANTKKGVQNIKLLDMTDAVVKKGSDIYTDALHNTIMIELQTGLPKDLATWAAIFSVSGCPEDKELAQLYKKIEKLLDDNLSYYDNIKKNMIINYSDLNNENEYYDIYGAPDKVVLNNRQHYNNCGIESTLNTLAMAGIIKMNENLKDQKSVEKTFLKSVIERGLANDSGVLGTLDEPDGGTFPDDYRDILEYFGISSKAYFMTSKADYNVYKDVNEFAYKISQGHGAVLGVCSDYLWNTLKSETNQITIDHAIAITGVVYAHGVNPAETDIEGNYINAPIGFYIHDSGAWMTRFISLEDFLKATLYNEQGTDKNAENYNKNLNNYDAKLGEYIGKEAGGFFTTITDAPIKTETFNLNATGDKYDNMIWGNNADNVIKGMNGNDTLYGGGGNDLIRGGNGNDIIVGNNVSEIDINIFKNHVSDNIGTILDKIQVSDNTLTGINDIYGDAGDDIIIGGNNSDLIYGGKGNDYIYGGDGRNAIYGEAGNDIIIGGFDNDRLFGGAGNDYLYGFADDDTIDGGAGNDHIYGGGGNDRIETGKGNDTVYFEGQDHGIDMISSAAGSTTLKFDDIDPDIPSLWGRNASDMFFTLEKEGNSKQYNLGIVYSLKNTSEETNGIEFLNFYNTKNRKFSNVSIVDKNNASYTISVSSKANASVANTKTDSKTVTIGTQKVANKDVNNILLSTNTTGTNILTSYKNDIVTMVGTNNKYDKTYDDEKIVDTIFYGDMNKIGSKRPDGFQYAGGYDKYISEERNTKYVVDFSENTTLSIYDNVVGLTKLDDDYQEIKNAVSTHDSLQLMSDFGHVEFFFDVAIDDDKKPITTDNNQLYVLFRDFYGEEDYRTARHIQIASDRENAQGFIYMDTFFGAENTLITNNGTDQTPEYDFFGNGRIETLLLDVETDQGEKTQPYSAFESDIVAIANDVAGWLSSDANTKNYKSAFQAFANATEDDADIQGLIAVYINGNRPTDG